MIELMLAMVIASMIVAAGFTVLYATDQGHLERDLHSYHVLGEMAREGVR